MIELVDTFNELPVPGEADDFQFSASPIPIHANHRIAKDKFGNPALLLAASDFRDGKVTANRRLQNVLILFDVKCKIQQQEEVLERVFNAICYTGRDSLLKDYFLKICSNLVSDLGDNPTHEQVRIHLARFIELFRLATEAPLKTVQGLWAELFLIAQSKSPDKLIQFWHQLPEENCDFNSGEERLEVKSTATLNRVHNFSLPQLLSPTGTTTIIASLFVRQISSGVDTESLKCTIEDRLSGDMELIEKLRRLIASTLGSSILEEVKTKFDFQLAKDSLAFYNAEDIPKVAIESIPATVYDVRFKSDLTLVQTVQTNELTGEAELFASI